MTVQLIRFGFPLSNDDFNHFWDYGLLGSDPYEMLYELVREYPMMVEVDREVWHSVDSTSTDAYRVTVAINDPQVEDQWLEDLAEVHECVPAALKIIKAAKDFTIQSEQLT